VDHEHAAQEQAHERGHDLVDAGKELRGKRPPEREGLPDEGGDDEREGEAEGRRH